MAHNENVWLFQNAVFLFCQDHHVKGSTDALKLTCKEGKLSKLSSIPSSLLVFVSFRVDTVMIYQRNDFLCSFFRISLRFISLEYFCALGTLLEIKTLFWLCFNSFMTETVIIYLITAFVMKEFKIPIFLLFDFLMLRLLVYLLDLNQIYWCKRRKYVGIFFDNFSQNIFVLRGFRGIKIAHFFQYLF